MHGGQKFGPIDSFNVEVAVVEHFHCNDEIAPEKCYITILLGFLNHQ